MFGAITIWYLATTMCWEACYTHLYTIAYTQSCTTVWKWSFEGNVSWFRFFSWKYSCSLPIKLPTYESFFFHNIINRTQLTIMRFSGDDHLLSSVAYIVVKKILLYVGNFIGTQYFQPKNVNHKKFPSKLHFHTVLHDKAYASMYKCV